jgi:hypothetical protein
VAVAVGRDDLLAATTLAEILTLLRATGGEERLLRGARSAWRSYTHWKWRSRIENPFSASQHTDVTHRNKQEQDLLNRTDQKVARGCSETTT